MQIEEEFEIVDFTWKIFFETNHPLKVHGNLKVGQYSFFQTIPNFFSYPRPLIWHLHQIFILVHSSGFCHTEQLSSVNEDVYWMAKQEYFNSFNETGSYRLIFSLRALNLPKFVRPLFFSLSVFLVLPFSIFKRK